MIRKTFFAAALIIGCSVAVTNAQTKYMTRNGFVGFYSHTSLEDIKADNNQAAAVLDPAKGEYAFTVLIKSFEFEKALMQEHFNENYLQSDKYPKATFTGKITDLSKVNFSKDGEYAVTVAGNLTIKDKTQPVTIPGTVIVKDGKIQNKAKFKVKPEDYNIEIPGMVKEKIAKEIEVTVDVKMDPVK